MVGAVVFLIPVFACFAIVTAGIGATTAIVLAIALGLTQGAEIDVITYLTTRHFGLRSFGALYGGVMVALSLGTAFGSLLAANVFDAFGSYIPFLWLTIGLMVASSIAIGTLKQPEEQANAQPAPAH
jgi:MFS family permease